MGGRWSLSRPIISPPTDASLTIPEIHASWAIDGSRFETSVLRLCPLFHSTAIEVTSGIMLGNNDFASTIQVDRSGFSESQGVEFTLSHWTKPNRLRLIMPHRVNKSRSERVRLLLALRTAY